MQTQPNAAEFKDVGIHYARIEVPGLLNTYYEVGCRGLVKASQHGMYACYGLCATDGPLIIPRREVSRGSTMTAVSAAGGDAA